ncbi:hypothetical protein GCK72_004804 [Caenorhabditis remanei]|uniref:Arrestin-like N-terminal domain-containing protein n=1 Tax=Caenorhabditis remanei TaxID=31234 RepID=A0A6A5HDC0_CAERE|nr:hypothetical protein GCK72_004804 [Caenorhabditis remanei]KAF1764854.1 hypothetical protein GCK72_004804 [Caenorhabditis remanei]
MNNILSPACIIFDGEDKPYFPGDTVTGVIAINLLKTEDARFLKLIWIGKAHTGWLTSVDSSCTKRFMEDYCYLWMSEDGLNKMPAGSYTFPFSFKLLDTFPPSFRGDSGYIKYKVKVELDRPKNFNLGVEKMFTVSKKVEISPDILEKGLKFREEKMIIGRIFNKGLVEVLVSKIL